MSDQQTEKAETEEAPVPVVQVSPPHSSGRLALFVSCLALAAALTQPLWQDKLYGEKPQQIVSAQTVVQSAPPPDLSPLESRLTALENKPLPSPPPPPPMPEMPDLSGIEQQLSALQALSPRLDEVEKQVNTRNTEDSAEKAMIVALLQLVMAWQSGQPFGSPWDVAMSVIEASDPDLASLLRDMAPLVLPWRDKGLATLNTLQAQFGPVARAAAVAAKPQAEGWWQQSVENVKSLVSIRRQGDAVSPQDTSAEATIARAELLLQNGDVSGAVDALSSLTGAAAEAVKPWLDMARARAGADALTGKLVSYLAQSIAPAAPAPAPEGESDTP
jgi:hypothetical protein